MRDVALKVPEWLRKNSVYQINPRTFSKEGTINAIKDELPFLKELGFNIIYICPIFEEDDDPNPDYLSPRQKKSKTGNPKNPYRINDYFFIDEEYGTMEDLKELVNEAHKRDMKVLLDLVYMHIGPNAPIIKRYPEFAKQDRDGNIVYTEYNFPTLDFRSEGLREYLYCNMVYYVSVLDVDGFRCDVGDAVPNDFWEEAHRRIRCIKEDAVLINEGRDYKRMVTAFESTYCFIFHEMLRNVFCGNEKASEIINLYNDIASQLPRSAKLLRDIDNHDTVTDWDGRTEAIAGNDGMEQILVINYLLDGIPMVYTGNELACKAKLSMFANRFHMGEFEVTDREDKYSDASIRRQSVVKTLNTLKSTSELLDEGKTIWLDVSAPNEVISFKRVLNDKELLFIGNTKNADVSVQIQSIDGKNVILSNGEHKIENNVLSLSAYEYVVFE